jgi:16S rRNA (guanine(966)-N(2))-methyltransferase RsmD
MSLRLSGGRRLQSPEGERARPTASRVRLAVINMLAPRLVGCHWLDLCCGSGVMACEALQHGAARVDAVEADRRIAAVARANLAAVAAGLHCPERSWQVHQQEVLRWLRTRHSHGSGQAQQCFDLIYCDPPYSSGLYGPVAQAVMECGLLKPQGLLVFECASQGVPPTPDNWHLENSRRYGGTTLLLLSCRADCRGDTGSRRP